MVDALQRATELCNQAGVALALVPPLPKTALSGAAWWLSPKKAVIQLSARHKSDDHLWFSFYHEAAHLLLHSKKSVFVDEVAGNGTDIEEEANRWAARTLVPPREWRRFVATLPRRKLAVQAFADQQGIAPGIVVGMLQHEGVIPWSHLNGLKVRLKWRDCRVAPRGTMTASIEPVHPEEILYNGCPSRAFDEQDGGGGCARVISPDALRHPQRYRSFWMARSQLRRRESALG